MPPRDYNKEKLVDLYDKFPRDEEPSLQVYALCRIGDALERIAQATEDNAMSLRSLSYKTFR
jgi:hypothetical protein